MNELQSGTQSPTAATRSFSGYGTGCRAWESLGCGRRCCGKIKQWVPTMNCSCLTPTKTDRPASVRQLYLITADHRGGLDHLGGPGGHSVASEATTIKCHDIMSTTPLSASVTLTRPAAHVPLRRNNVCAIETRFHCLRRLQPPMLHVCTCLCASDSCTGAGTAAPGKQRVAVSCLVRLPSCHTLRQSANNERIRV